MIKLNQAASKQLRQIEEAQKRRRAQAAQWKKENAKANRDAKRRDF